MENLTEGKFLILPDDVENIKGLARALFDSFWHAGGVPSILHVKG
jgi:hypothetical protein